MPEVMTIPDLISGMNMVLKIMALLAEQGKETDGTSFQEEY